MNSDRGTHWSVTINNPRPADDENIALARQKKWKVEGQMEVGKEDGTPHYQLMVTTPQVRFSAVKKAFPRAHIEKARKPKALAAYVKKEDTRVGTIPDDNDKYPSLSKFWALVETLQNDFPIESYPAGKGRRLLQLDDITRCLIENGYHVETIAINPATRSAYERYGEQIMYRAFMELAAVNDAKHALSTSSSQPAQTETKSEDRQVNFSSDDITIPTHAPEAEDYQGEGSSDGSDGEGEGDGTCSFNEDAPDGEEFSEEGEADYQWDDGDEVCDGDDC